MRVKRDYLSLLQTIFLILIAESAIECKRKELGNKGDKNFTLTFDSEMELKFRSSAELSRR